MKILFLVPYGPKEAPSQRFRFEQYFGLLSASGHTYEVHSFLSLRDTRLFAKSGGNGRKFVALFAGFLKRFTLLFVIHRFDRIFIHREATPLGPPIIEWFLSKVLNKRIIFDFDDAIWLTDKKEENNIIRWLKWRKKVATICRWSSVVSCGNSFLCNYASQFNSQALVNPTTLETRSHHILTDNTVERDESKVIIGWTGSHSTLKYLHTLEGILQLLETKYPSLSVLVIADRAPDLKLDRIEFYPWSVATEIKDLARIDIGIMPLEDDDWTRGKCGFKALQYMALEIPAVVSPVGVNIEIVEDGITGFLCQSAAAWLDRLSFLIEHPEVRKKMGRAAREKVNKNYSVESNSERFLSLFK